eukprot:scaffold784_cov62-Cylindrotheca_fusiformis.AAC.1
METSTRSFAYSMRRVKHGPNTAGMCKQCLYLVQSKAKIDCWKEIRRIMECPGYDDDGGQKTYHFYNE